LKARIAAAAAVISIVVPSSTAAASTTATLHHRQARQVSTIHRDLGTLRFFRRHPRQARSSTGRRAIRFARAELRWTRRELGETRAQLRVRRWPPHLALWLCIHHGEGAWGAVGRGDAAGHYNGLQMTWSWGYGIVGDPNRYTPMQIMWAAERGYAASHYRASWLEQQWGATMPPCWSFA
jgi:hypothetical protein